MLSKTVSHDMRCGITANGGRYLIALFFFSAMSISFFSTADRMSDTFWAGQTASALDCWFHNLEGIGIFVPTPGVPFPVPMIWLVLQAILASLIVSYPTQDLYGYGSQILLRMKHRGIWWLSKCFWNFCTVLLYYSLGLLTTCVCSLFWGELSWRPTAEINFLLSSVDLSQFSFWHILELSLFLPFFTSLALSLLQMTLSLLLSPLYGYLAVICYVLAAAYYCSPFLIPNFSMALRHSSVTPDGLNTATALVANGSVIVLAVIGGLIYFEHCDILKDKKRG